MDFYFNHPHITKFSEITNSANYSKVPDSWTIIITDVVNSTIEISQGRYKEVNTAGALAIAAITNLNLHKHIPIVFGGDGVTLITPPECLEQIKDILYGIRKFVKEGFDLDLRIGLASVSEVSKGGYDVFVGKFSENKPFQQALFWGEGFDYAEKLIKDPDGKHLLPEDYKPKIEPNYSGFSCPFREVKNDNGNIISLILKKASSDSNYEKSISELFKLLGSDKEYYPISFNNLFMKTKAAELYIWRTVASGTNKGFKYWLFGLLLPALTNMIMLSVKKLQAQASRDLPFYTDHRKFDGSLKMVISCNNEKLEKLKNWLDEKEKNGDIIYGIHQSDSCLITCLFNAKKDDKELHLIDGADGGYTLAAKLLKEKLAISK